MAGQISLLLPHLGGKAYALRSAIVASVASLVHKGFDSAAEGADAQGEAPVMCPAQAASRRPLKCSKAKGLSAPKPPPSLCPPHALAHTYIFDLLFVRLNM